MITHSEYTQTDPVVLTPVPQPVRTVTDTGTQVEITGNLLMVLALALLVRVVM